VRGRRRTGPHRTGLARGGVADGEDEIHVGRAVDGVLIPALAAHTAYVDAASQQRLDRERIDPAERKAPSAVGLEPAAAQEVHQALGQYAARGVAGAKKEYVMNFIVH